MIGRGWVVVLLALSPMAGCGMGVRKLDADALTAATTVPREFTAPPHRVALATFEAMRSELASAEFAGDSQFVPGPARRDGSKPKPGDLPADFPAFWLEWTSQGKPVRELLGLRAAHFKGRTADGRPVEVEVVAQGPKVAQVAIRVDQLGDRMLSNRLLEATADRLAHPAAPPGSPEAAATYQAFFGGVESREALPSLRKVDPASKAAIRPR